jgi:hypothetical protein
VLLAVLLGAALAACTSASAPPALTAGPRAVDLSIPALPATCAPRGVVAGAEAEPSLAVGPSDPNFLVAAWQQDRHPQGTAGAIGFSVSHDGGKTWKGALLPGETPCTEGAFARVSDPTAGIGADGTAYIAAPFLRPGLKWPGGFTVSVSHDHALSWSLPVAVLDLADPLQVVDKPFLATDPRRPGTAYAAWVQYRLDRPDAQPRRDTFYFARTTDGGATWWKPLAVYGADSENQFHQLFVLPDGALLDVFVEAHELPDDQSAAAANVAVRLRALRSSDQGSTWSAPVDAAAFTFTAAASPGDAPPVRATGAHITAAVGADGAAYAAFQEHYPQSSSSINLVRSPDGGRTWGTPARVVSVTGDLMLPQLATDGRRTLGLLWYAFDAPPGQKLLPTSIWFATAPAKAPLAWSKKEVLVPFDLARAVNSGGYFLGDYAGLVGMPSGFAAALPVIRKGGIGPSAIDFVRIP